MKRRTLMSCLCTALLLVTGAAFAQQADAPKSKIKGKTSGQIRVSDVDRGGTDLGVIDIEGRIYKPSVFLVLARGDIKYTGLDMKQNFTDRIVKGAMKRPF